MGGQSTSVSQAECSRSRVIWVKSERVFLGEGAACKDLEVRENVADLCLRKITGPCCCVDGQERRQGPVTRLGQ